MLGISNATTATALRVLSGVDRSLEKTQARISTGLRVATARDDAALWSVSTVVRSDISALNQIRDNLGILHGELTVARHVAETIVDLVGEIKVDMVHGFDSGDKVNAIKEMLSTVPLLREDSERWVPSFVQGGDARYLKVRGFDLTPPDVFGLVVGEGPLELVYEIPFQEAAGVAWVGSPEVTRMVRDLRAGDVLSVGDVSVELTSSDLTAAASALAAELGASGYAVAMDDPLLGSDAAVVFNGVTPGLAPLRLERRGEALPAEPDWVAVEAYMQQAIDAAAAFGSMQKRIELHTEYVGTVVDEMVKGVGVLVDANMPEESARLAAVQTQRQLAAQGLAIANRAPEALLQLFGR